MIWETSPAAAELEEKVMEWLRQATGLPEGMHGVIQDSASSSTLCALLAARETATNFTTNEKGAKTPLVIYASEEAHSSIEKDAKIAGYGRENIRYISTDENFALIPSRLEEAIERDKKNGLQPACVVATLGTTSSTAVDPLKPTGEICKHHNLWLHVDAAYAGAAALLEEKRDILEGAEYMDSFVFNPHKWLFTNFDCSAYFVKNPELLVRTMEIHPEYLKTALDEQVKNYRDWSVQLGRRFRALKLWFVIRSYGIKGLREMLREHIRLARLFKTWVEQDSHFEVLAPVNFSVVCFRLNSGNRSEEQLNSMNKELLAQINATGRAYLTHTTLKGKYTIRMAIGQRSTQEHHIRETWELIKEKASAILEK